MKLYVEGGGDAKPLRTACREGVTRFLTESGLKNRPRVVACGSRKDAFDSFCTAIANGEAAMMLVDSEAAVDAADQAGDPETWRPWQHLKRRDNWDKPDNCSEADCHLMVECMETWFLADRKTLSRFFGQGFKENQLPSPGNAIEQIPKVRLYEILRLSTDECKTKDAYGKGEHSFKLLKEIDPAKVTAASPWASRFVSCLKVQMDS